MGIFGNVTVLLTWFIKMGIFGNVYCFVSLVYKMAIFENVYCLPHCNVRQMFASEASTFHHWHQHLHNIAVNEVTAVCLFVFCCSADPGPMTLRTRWLFVFVSVPIQAPRWLFVFVSVPIQAPRWLCLFQCRSRPQGDCLCLFQCRSRPGARALTSASGMWSCMGWMTGTRSKPAWTGTTL